LVEEKQSWVQKFSECNRGRGRTKETQETGERGAELIPGRAKNVR
jgi:hypothetical protein